MKCVEVNKSLEFPFLVILEKIPGQRTFFHLLDSVDAMTSSSAEDWTLDDDEEAFLDSEEPADAIAVRNWPPKWLLGAQHF